MTGGPDPDDGHLGAVVASRCWQRMGVSLGTVAKPRTKGTCWDAAAGTGCAILPGSRRVLRAPQGQWGLPSTLPWGQTTM